MKFIDYVVLFYIVWMALNGLSANNYSYKMQAYYKAMIGGFSYALFYYWGRYSHFKLTDIFKNMLYPLLLCMLTGLYFFISPPAWYLAMKYNQLNDTGDTMHYEEIFRLSSFWGHPYHICYSITLFSIYLQYKLLSGKTKNKAIDIALLTLCAVVLFCGQLRVCIIFFLASFLLMMLLNKGKYFKSKLLYIYIAVFAVLFLFAISSLSNKINFEYVNTHMSLLTDEESMEGRLEGTAGLIKTYSLEGEGFGKYQLIARQYKKYAIIDNQYANTLAELGYLGLSLLVLIILLSLYRMFTHQKYYIEICVVLFYFVNWFGASSLINSSQYAFIFWFCLGRLWSDSNYTYFEPKEDRFIVSNVR